MEKYLKRERLPEVFVDRQPKLSPATPSAASQPNKAVPEPAPGNLPATPAARGVAPVKASHDEIARRAYRIYVEQGCPEGQCEHNWRQAEEE